MPYTMTFRTVKQLTEQKDVLNSIHVPMVYERVPAEPAKWEYRVLIVDRREEDLPEVVRLNELGEQGWLLVGVLDQGNSKVHYYFVRQKSE
jgi:hypothetical protein